MLKKEIQISCKRPEICDWDESLLPQSVNKVNSRLWKNSFAVFKAHKRFSFNTFSMQNCFKSL